MIDRVSCRCTSRLLPKWCVVCYGGPGIMTPVVAQDAVGVPRISTTNRSHHRRDIALQSGVLLDARRYLAAHKRYLLLVSTGRVAPTIVV